LMQQQRAQQFIATLTSMDAASRNPLIRQNEPQQFQPPPTLELLRFLGQGKGDRVTPRDTLLQAQAPTGLLTTMFPFGNLGQDRVTRPSSAGAPTRTPLPIPQPYGKNGEAESFPGKLYRLLAGRSRA
jgi:hypothetical protein